MRLETWSRFGVAAVVLLVSATPVLAQRALDLANAPPSRVTADASLDGHERAVARFHVVASAPIVPVWSWPSRVPANRPRWRRYALIGSFVGFAASALIAKSIICPSSCIDTGEASYPIVGVVFYGVIGAGVGALIGGGIGAVRDQHADER